MDFAPEKLQLELQDLVQVRTSLQKALHAFLSKGLKQSAHHIITWHELRR